MPLDDVVFWVFAPISIASAIGMLLVRNAIHAALFLVVNFFCLAVFYLLLDAPFLFAVQIVVYAGAIMVLFLFVIMLLGVDSGVPIRFVLGAAFVVELFLAIRAGVGFATRAPEVFTANEGGNTQAVAKVLFTQYFFPFEVTSVLLLVAAIAAMVLAHRRARAVTQAEIDAAAEDVDETPVYDAGAAS
jgi:NADH-quinone oxidoreductase subunit J